MASTVIPSLRTVGTGIRMLVVATVLLGIAYPLALVLVGRLMPFQTDGSPVTVHGEQVGSALIGQTFEGPRWFHSRPSAAGDGYDPRSSGASNLSPENDDLLATIAERRAAVAADEGVHPSEVPADAVTASASGLDPEISVAYAELQIDRVAAVRGLDDAVVAELVVRSTTQPVLGFLGEPRVNVLLLNAALEAADAGQAPVGDRGVDAE